MQAVQTDEFKSTARLEVRLILESFCYKILPVLKSTRPVSTGRVRFCMEVNDV